MRVVTPAEMREADRRTIERGTPGLELMERAGAGAARVVRDHFADVGKRRFLVLCGKGNNGGDGFVVARILAEWGARVDILCMAPLDSLTGDAGTNAARALDAGLSAGVYPDRFRERLDAADGVIDALLGTGVEGAPRDPFPEVICAVNGSGVPVVALDLASGVNGRDGSVADVAILADVTVTFGAPKIGHFFFPGRAHSGHVHVVDIGIPEDAYDTERRRVALTPEVVRPFLPARRPDGHKGTFGRVLVVGGSPGMSGAVALAARAAMRSGAGLVTMAVPAGLLNVVEGLVPEATSLPLAETPSGGIAATALADLAGVANTCDALVVGPGLGKDPDTVAFVRAFLSTVRAPAVVDADALNAFGKDVSALAGSAPRVLTPHPGEAGRLLERTTVRVLADRFDALDALAAASGATVVLKGAPTLTGDGATVTGINVTGNSGLAKGGSGDVLSGILGALLAQGVPPRQAADLGVHLHGFAADILVEDVTEWSLLPTDVIEALPEAFRRLAANEEVTSWIR